LFSCLAAAADFLSVLIAWELTAQWNHFSRAGAGWHRFEPALAAALAFATAAWFLGGYRSFRICRAAEELWFVAQATGAGGVLLTAWSWVVHHDLPAPGEVAVLLFAGGALVSTERAGLRAGLRWARRRGYNLRYYLIAGTGERARAIAEQLGAEPSWGIRVIGYLGGTNRAENAAPPSHVIGMLPDLDDILATRVVDAVIFATEDLGSPSWRDALLCCRRLGIPALVDLEPLEEMRGYLKISALGSSPLLVIGQTRLAGHQLLLKRGFDIVLAGMGIAITAPLMACITLLLRLTTPGPALFRQKRVGMNGRTFTMYKFRTMVEDAERLQPAMAGENEMDGPVFKIRRDPGVTPLGRVLRRLSLDELPQLWNVLLGDMSLVGPRPPLPHEVRQYRGWQRRRLSVRPGITCLWQVKGRNRIGFDGWMKLDLEYIDNWSWWLDFKILLRTLPAMVRGQ
jgi:exopolysaccharide biosynthesis polyprenyl glycosylphosphotransferase